jgi:hypothetical protein
VTDACIGDRHQQGICEGPKHGPAKASQGEAASGSLNNGLRNEFVTRDPTAADKHGSYLSQRWPLILMQQRRLIEW